MQEFYVLGSGLLWAPLPNEDGWSHSDARLQSLHMSSLDSNHTPQSKTPAWNGSLSEFTRRVKKADARFLSRSRFLLLMPLEASGCLVWGHEVAVSNSGRLPPREGGRPVRGRGSRGRPGGEAHCPGHSDRESHDGGKKRIRRKNPVSIYCQHRSEGHGKPIRQLERSH